MKKIDLSNTGGHPLKTDNFTHLMTGIQEALINLGFGLGFDGSPGFKLWGINYTVLTSTDITWTAGAMYINGEICAVPAGSATKTGGQVFKFERYTTALPIDPQTYADAATHDVHLETYARIIAAASVGIGEVAVDCGTLADIISPPMVQEALGSGAFTAEDDLAAPVTFTTTVRTVSWRVVNNMMLIDINVSGSVAAPADNLFIELPGSNTAAGNYHGTVFIADKAYIVKAETGQTKLKIASGGTDSFSGSFDIEGQLTLMVQ